MKRILFFALFIFASLLSFSQRSTTDTINLFQTKKKEKKDAVKEIQSHSQNTQDLVYYVKYGTSAGKCTGYCFHESTIDSIHIVTVSKPWQADNNYPVKTDTALTTQTQWDMLINSIDKKSFFTIPKKVGKPGEGGAEYQWIEVNYAGKIHKVTYVCIHILIKLIFPYFHIHLK